MIPKPDPAMGALPRQGGRAGHHDHALTRREMSNVLMRWLRVGEEASSQLSHSARTAATSATVAELGCVQQGCGQRGRGVCRGDVCCCDVVGTKGQWGTAEAGLSEVTRHTERDHGMPAAQSRHVLMLWGHSGLEHLVWSAGLRSNSWPMTLEWLY